MRQHREPNRRRAWVLAAALVGTVAGSAGAAAQAPAPQPPPGATAAAAPTAPAVAPAAAPAVAPAPKPTPALEWKSADGTNRFKIGLLGQMQAESADVAGTNDSAENLFFRRLRVLFNFNLGDKLTVFLETDSPNLGKSSNAGVKDANDAFIQDFVATYKVSQQFMLDGGLLLMEQSYNHNQSAATLLSTDYGPYSFVESAPLAERIGRDYGVRARGYLAGDHLEYRLGVYDGLRGQNAANDLRFAGRLMYSFFTAPVGLFYRGTSLGKTKTLSLGAGFDVQDDYEQFGVDFFLDHPIAGGNGLVLQGDLSQIDGSTFVATLPEQTNVLFEAGFFIASAKLQPYLQYAAQDFDAANRVDEERTTVGLGYYVSGHNNNVKFSYTRIEPDGGDSRDQINVQWQIFQF